MNRSRALTGLFAGCALIVGAFVAPAMADGDGPHPPKNLKLVGDHWTPWDPPEASPDAYTIVKGDTLWDLASRWLDDPYLWPQIWDENRYILDSHWIYPGDPLVIPGRPTVVPDSGPPPGVDLPADPAPVVSDNTPRGPLAPSNMELLAVESDLYCSGYIDADYANSELTVAGTEMENEHSGQGHVIYLSQGRDAGLAAGDLLMIQKAVRQVNDPETGERIGDYVQRLGRARVMLAQESKSVAVIELSCAEIDAGDELVEWVEIPVPQRDSIPPFDRYALDPTGGPVGKIVTSRDDLTIMGEGHIISTNIGELSGARPGDIVTLYRENGDLPRMNLGQAVILTVEPETSTARITVSVREMGVGDRAEIVR